MLLEANNISFRYTEKSPWILENVSFKVAEGERIGIVGPSGYGKSTLAKILAGYEQPSSGEVKLDGAPLPMKGYCPVQMIYQHPELSVNPRWKMAKTLNECWTPDKELLEKMGIEEAWLKRWPSELSGGELQRFCIARSLSPETKFLICDEISTMLDVITQAQIWNILLDTAKERNMGMVIITHNIALAERICTNIIRVEEM
ncbi:ABC transporter ATP-binding protein [Butyrivibrio sp. XB500-5]|uniref:ABC transporter ATP-binding protein n=1 Tax=Butyrivibrio sp. XB500-5 TaxID=2364880 RepID=UPI000EA8FFCC|nr:ABC transporter ATP-binding protein [Butyrivibrio sp. XB500-5]RKM58557.1 ABC transporter ATP-binding protein [Butyrivibrio sp. XB500-5]